MEKVPPGTVGKEFYQKEDELRRHRWDEIGLERSRASALE